MGEPEEASVPADKTVRQLQYLHRPPRIMPHYKKTRVSILPKSNISRVLLYDNVTQEQMLNVKLSHINIEKRRSNSLMENHKKAFILRQAIKQKQLRAMGITNVSFLPEAVASSHCKGVLHEDQSNRPTTNILRINGETEAVSPDNTVQLPDINEHKKYTVQFPSSPKNGVTKMFHTYMENSNTLDPDLYLQKTVYDPRFTGLEKTLIPSEFEHDGYLELSPSYRQRYRTITDNYPVEVKTTSDLEEL